MGDANRRRHRLGRARTVALVAAGLVVAVVAATVLVIRLRERPSAQSTDVAVDRFRSAPSTPPAGSGVARPAAGVYDAVGEGNEYVGFSPLDEPFGPSVPVTVHHVDDRCWELRADLNTHHWRSWELCSTDDGLVERRGVSSTQRKFPGIDFSNVSTFVCDPPVMLRPSTGSVGGTTTSTAEPTVCSGTADGLEGTTSDALTATVVGDEQLEIGGTTRPVVHLRTDGVFTGAQVGTERIDLWVEPATNLPVRIAFDTQVATETPFGRIDYRDVGSFTLVGTTART